MLVIVGGIISICLSTLNKKDADAVNEIHDEPEASVPVVYPILVSLTVPLFMTANVMIAKYATTVSKVSGRDFTFANFFVLALILSSASMYYFYSTEGSFNLH